MKFIVYSLLIGMLVSCGTSHNKIRLVKTKQLEKKVTLKQTTIKGYTDDIQNLSEKVEIKTNMVADSIYSSSVVKCNIPLGSAPEEKTGLKTLRIGKRQIEKKETIISKQIKPKINRKALIGFICLLLFFLAFTVPIGVVLVNLAAHEIAKQPSAYRAKGLINTSLILIIAVAFAGVMFCGWALFYGDMVALLIIGILFLLALIYFEIKTLIWYKAQLRNYV